MPMSRRCAGRRSMRLSPNRIAPPSSSQKPAIMRSRVVLPQPEGPNRVKNSPSPTSRSTPSTARTLPKLRLAPAIVMPATLAGVLQDVLDALERLGALLRPAFLVVLREFHRRHRRHAARQLAEIDVAARRPPEGRLEDGLAHVLAVDEVDEGP